MSGTKNVNQNHNDSLIFYLSLYYFYTVEYLKNKESEKDRLIW